MAKDLLVDQNGDLVIDNDSKDFAEVDGIEEVAQRIKATLDIRYGEMERLDPEMGSDYRGFLGKKPDLNGAVSDMTAAITANVPEVESVTNFKLTRLPKRGLLVEFTATVNVDGKKQKVDESYDYNEQ
ncbi:MAG: hypothetical protein [Bacteriophage sp.]|nr:MAG: hypothetical protein [Bacteriophage sp.]